MKIVNKTAFVATAATLLIAGCASDDHKKMHSMDKSMDTMGQCHGVNSCKGNSACATAESACTGHNSCKGKGWIKTSQADCEVKGGKFMMK